MNREDGCKAERSDCEFKTPRRRFSAKQKLRILEEADACTEPGEIGALVRREGVCSWWLSRWRRTQDCGQIDRLGGKKRGPKRAGDREFFACEPDSQNRMSYDDLAPAQELEIGIKLSQLLPELG